MVKDLLRTPPDAGSGVLGAPGSPSSWGESLVRGLAFGHMACGPGSSSTQIARHRGGAHAAYWLPNAQELPGGDRDRVWREDV